VNDINRLRGKIVPPFVRLGKSGTFLFVVRSRSYTDLRPAWLTILSSDRPNNLGVLAGRLEVAQASFGAITYA
jgi:hypothetical protein